MPLNNKIKGGTPYQWAWVIIIVVCIFMLWNSCKSCKGFDEPETIVPAKKVIEKIRVDSIASKKFKDSVNNIIAYWEREASKWQRNWEQEAEESGELQQEYGELLNQIVPDTCKPYQEKLIALNSKLSAHVRNANISCGNTIKAKDNIITQKDKLIQQGKNDYDSLRNNTNILYNNQLALEKKLPKREITIGVRVISGYTAPIKPQAGIELGYRNKKGFEVNIGYYTNNQVSLGIKKTLLRL